MAAYDFFSQHSGTLLAVQADLQAMHHKVAGNELFDAQGGQDVGNGLAPSRLLADCFHDGQWPRKECKKQLYEANQPMRHANCVGRGVCQQRLLRQLDGVEHGHAMKTISTATPTLPSLQAATGKTMKSIAAYAYSRGLEAHSTRMQGWTGTTP
jgi:hypothetical protein